MRRRDFIKGVANSAAAWPLAARAQQSAMPVVGMLNGQSADSYSLFVDAMRLGLKDEGFVEGQNVMIEYRWAAGHEEQLPAMAVELVNRHVAVLVTGGSGWSTISAKAATATIPIVFTTASDPIKLGYVTSLNRPGGNVTGVSFLASQLVAKRLELASQLVPKEVIIGFLGRPQEPRYAADKKISRLPLLRSAEKYCLSTLRANATSNRRSRLLPANMLACSYRSTIRSLMAIAARSLRWRRAMPCRRSTKRASL
jgi:ABC-type uncharacterized transport system substrate-binding protein